MDSWNMGKRRYRAFSAKNRTRNKATKKEFAATTIREKNKTTYEFIIGNFCTFISIMFIEIVLTGPTLQQLILILRSKLGNWKLFCCWERKSSEAYDSSSTQNENKEGVANRLRKEEKLPRWVICDYPQLPITEPLGNWKKEKIWKMELLGSFNSSTYRISEE